MQLNRYIIAILLPEILEQQLRQLYQYTYHKPCPVRTLHTTILPPFVIKAGYTPASLVQTLTTLPDFLIPFTFGPAGIFTVGSRRILYLPVLPVAPLQTVYAEIFRVTQPHITIETKTFNRHQLPAFLPHVTLNYHFQDTVSALLPPHHEFRLPAPQLLVEAGPGLWQPVA